MNKKVKDQYVNWLRKLESAMSHSLKPYLIHDHVSRCTIHAVITLLVRNIIRLTHRTLKIAKPYNGQDVNGDFNLSSTLEKLYAWEKKLYKKFKDKEKLRTIYEEKCNWHNIWREECDQCNARFCVKPTRAMGEAK